MSDFLFTFLAIAGVCLAIRGLVPQLHFGWLAAGSALLGAAGLTRNVGFALVLVLGVCSAVWFSSSLRRSGLAFVTATLPALFGFRLLLERLQAGTWPLPWIERHARLEPLRTSGAIRRLQ